MGKSLLIKEMLALLTDASGNETWPVLSLLLRALLVLALMVAVLLLWRRMQRSRGPGAIQVLAEQRLSAAHSVYLVRVGERQLLLGGGSSGLSLLCDLSTLPAPVVDHEPGQAPAELVRGFASLAPALAETTHGGSRS